jgi:hypothetical protein
MDPIVSREAIAKDADAAAAQMARTGVPAVNRYPEGSEAARIWQCYLHRFLHLYSTPTNAEGIEGSA